MAFAIRQGKLGGGGHIAGFDISPDGTTRIALNDTTGGFFWYSPTTSNNPVTDTAGTSRLIRRIQSLASMAATFTRRPVLHPTRKLFTPHGRTTTTAGWRLARFLKARIAAQRGPTRLSPPLTSGRPTVIL
jgi:hypothetical protein